MPERSTKRGYSSQDALAKKEAKLLRGYPPWAAWKPALTKHLRKRNLGGLNNAESLVHEWYILRRRQQIGHNVGEEIQSFKQSLGSKHADLLKSEAVQESIRFITDKTERPPKYKIRR